VTAILLHEVAHRFGRRWALRGVTVSVAFHEILAIVGHNGSGKSTLLRVAATAIRPTRGRGTVLGADLVRNASAVRSMVALLSTDPGVYGDLTALENLKFSARMLGTSADALSLQRALDRVGLGREGHERARHMSSGMQRRLSIARLMLRTPRVLLLDEPYNSLDAEGVELVNVLVRETRERGGSVILVAHDLSRAGGLPDRTIEMRDGLLDDSPTETSLGDEVVSHDVAALTPGRSPALRVERGGMR
jgi:heme exporter protein A